MEAGIASNLFSVLLPGVIIAGTLLSAFFIFCGRTLVYGMPHTARIEQRGSSVFLGKIFMEYWMWLWGPFYRFFARHKASPDAITLAGGFCSVLAAVAFFFGNFVAGGWLVILGGTLDILDGTVARLTGRTSVAGAFLDSQVDRYAELIAFAGLLGYYQGTWFFFVVFAALIGSMMVSYTRSRAGEDGVNAKVGSMQRPERVLYIGVSAALAPLVAAIFEPGAVRPDYHLAMIGIGIVAIFSNTTALHRMLFTLRTLRSRDQEAKQRKAA
jgi:CDP-diacylglycerol--glycerol-3-phosphate 3-phosphatidyltransferase